MAPAHPNRGVLGSGGAPTPTASPPSWPPPARLPPGLDVTPGKPGPSPTPGSLTLSGERELRAQPSNLSCFLTGKRPVSPYSGYNGQLLTSVYQPTEMALMHKGPVSGVPESPEPCGKPRSPASVGGQRAVRPWGWGEVQGVGRRQVSLSVPQPRGTQSSSSWRLFLESVHPPPSVLWRWHLPGPWRWGVTH